MCLIVKKANHIKPYVRTCVLHAIIYGNEEMTNITDVITDNPLLKIKFHSHITRFIIRDTFVFVYCFMWTSVFVEPSNTYVLWLHMFSKNKQKTNKNN